MTSNERKILKCLWDAKGRSRVKAVSQNIGFTVDYTRLICRSLARSGYLVLVGSNEYCLLKKGSMSFEDISRKEVPEDSAVLAAHVALLTNVEENASPSAMAPDGNPLDSTRQQPSKGDEASDEASGDDASGEVSRPANDEALEKVLARINFFPKNAEEENKKELPSMMGGDTDASEGKVEDKKEEEISVDREEKVEVSDETALLEIEEKAEIQIALAGANVILSAPAIEESPTGMQYPIESAHAPIVASSLDALPDASEKDKEKLVQAGYKTVGDLAHAPLAKLIQELGVRLRKAAHWINEARHHTNEGD